MRILIYKSQFASTYRDDAAKVAIKKFPGAFMHKYDRPLYLGSGDVRLLSGREAVEAEIAKLRLVAGGKHVVQLMDVVENPDFSIELVFAWAGQPVMTWDRKNKLYEKMYDFSVTDVLRQTLAGVNELHAVGIVHKDLQPHNVLVAFGPEIQPEAHAIRGSLHIRICDLGSAVFVDKANPIIYDAQGTLHYTPPEILLHGECEGFKRDMWSVGILLFALLTCKLPFMTESEILTEEIQRGEGMSDDAWEMIQGLTQRDVNKRWNVEQSIDARYINSCSLSCS